MRLIGLALAIAGVWLLREAWQRKAKNKPRVLVGWSLIFGCIVLWGLTSGPDKGPALGIIVALVVVLCFLASQAFKAEVRPRRESPNRIVIPDKITARGYLSRIWTGLLIGPLAGLSALAICTAAFSVFQTLNVEHTLNLTLVSFGFPLLWGSLAVFAGYNTRGLAKTVAIFISGLAPLAYIMLSA